MYRIGGIPADRLAEQFGTPLYVYDEARIRERMEAFRTAFVSKEFDTLTAYASKAFSCKEMVRLAEEYSFGLDVVSEGELYTAEQAGFGLSRVLFHGNNKSLREIDYALNIGAGTIVVDSMMEAELLAERSSMIDHSVHVLLRVNPGIEAHTHKYIVTAHVDSKFGVALADEDQVVETIRILENADHLIFDGLDAHIGSQIFDGNAFAEEIRKLFAFAGHLQEAYGIAVHTVDLGGGFAACYTSEDRPVPVPEVCRIILEACEEENRKIGGMVRKVIIEPGRSIVAEAGYTLYTVGFLKKTPNKEYLFVDGGMSDNIRPALYQASYDALLAGKEDQEAAVTYTVAGKLCESGDILIPSIVLPEAHTGDILIVKTTGAYGYAMASRYNKQPVPAVVFAKDGNARAVIRRETLDDMVGKEY